MGITNRLMLAVATLFLSSSALAQIPYGTWRVWAAAESPSDEFAGHVVTIPTVVEANSAVGLGFSYEMRASDSIGLEVGIRATDFDFDFTAEPLGTMRFGSSSMVPLTLGARFHFRGERLVVVDVRLALQTSTQDRP